MTTRLGKVLLYVLSISFVIFIFLSIGISNIYRELISVSIPLGLGSLLVSLAATLIRIYKFKILLNNKHINSVLEVFVTSRIGKEVSFGGYFIPLIRKSNRNNATFRNLVVDRYTEIYATLSFALLAFIFIPSWNYLVVFLFVLISLSLVLLTLLPFVKIQFLNRFNNKLTTLIFRTANLMQEKLQLNSKGILKIYALSAVSTFLDFKVALLIFNAYNIDIDFHLIPIVWASSGIVSMLAFMLIGFTELSVVYLYNFLAGLSNATIASFVIISRVINIAVLFVLFVYLICAKYFRKPTIMKRQRELDKLSCDLKDTSILINDIPVITNSLQTKIPNKDNLA